MAVGDAYVFPGFLTPVPTTFLTPFRGERQKYVGKKFRLIRRSNSQPPGHEPDKLTTQPTRRAFQLGKGPLGDATYKISKL